MAGGSKSKNKGNLGERELSKILVDIFGGSFIRSNSSGAFIGGKNSFRKNTLSDGQVRNSKGDITPPDFMPKLVLEVKNYKDFKFHQLMMPGRCPQLDTWIKQTIDCIDEGDNYFVCFKISRTGWFIAVPDLSYGYKFGNHCIYKSEYGNFTVTDLNDFFVINHDLVLSKSS